MTNSMGVSNLTLPANSVAMKAKIWTPVGITTASLAAEK